MTVPFATRYRHSMQTNVRYGACRPQRCSRAATDRPASLVRGPNRRRACPRMRNRRRQGARRPSDASLPGATFLVRATSGRRTSAPGGVTRVAKHTWFPRDTPSGIRHGAHLERPNPPPSRLRSAALRSSNWRDRFAFQMVTNLGHRGLGRVHSRFRRIAHGEPREGSYVICAHVVHATFSREPNNHLAWPASRRVRHLGVSPGPQRGDQVKPLNAAERFGRTAVGRHLFGETDLRVPPASPVTHQTAVVGEQTCSVPIRGQTRLLSGR